MRIIWIILAIASFLIIWFFLSLPGFARDSGQWGAVDPVVKNWFSQLMQPDNPDTPCCGESDAYWADSYEIYHDQYVAIVTDTRDDAPLHRPHVDPGTKILIPPEKLKFDRGNPTGHGIVFLGSALHVYCYLPPGGV